MIDKLERFAAIRRIWAGCCVAVLASAAVAAGAGAVGSTAVATGRDDASVARPAATRNGAADGLERHKRIAANDDGSYTLNLDVKAPTDSSADGRMPLDVTMVLDVSGSMVDVSRQKFENLKKAAGDFLDKTDQLNQAITNPANRHRVSLVKFSGDITDKIGDDMYTGDGQPTNYTQILSHFTTDFADLRRKIDALKAAGRTQSDHAMTHARTTMKRSRDGVRKAVIFFTDGAPMGEANSQGITFYVDIANAALNTAKTIKEEGVSIYSIGLLPNASLDGTIDENVFLHAISSNYPKASNVFKGEWVPWGKWKRWNITQLEGNLGRGSRQSGFYKPVRDSAQLAGIFDTIHRDLTVAPAYKGVTITDNLSEHVRPVGLTYDTAVQSGGFYKITSGAELHYDGETATAPVRGRDYDLWFNPNANGSIQARFAADHMLTARRTYTLRFNVEPTQKAYETYARNKRDGKTGAALYDGTTGSPHSDMPGNTTSANKPGFYSNTTATIDYTKDGKEGHTPYDDHPVVQVASSTLHIVKEWQGAGDKPKTLKVNVMQGDTIMPVTLTADENGEWKTSLTIPAGEEKRYQVRENNPGTQWNASYRHRLGTQADETGDTVVIPASRTTQNATVTITNSQATVGLAGDSITVRKTVTGWYSPSTFSFTMRATGPNANNVQWPGRQRSSSATATIVSQSHPVTVGFTDELRFPIPDSTGKRDVYTFSITEDGARHAPAGWQYDQTDHRVTVTVAYDDTARLWKATASPSHVEFANHYVSVSALPLTGGTQGNRWATTAIALGLIATVLIGSVAYRATHPYEE